MQKEIESWVNGSWVPNSKVGCSLYSSHYMLGIAAFDALRTYNHKIFRCDEHIDRFLQSIKSMGMETNFPSEYIKRVLVEVMEHNQKFFDGDEYRFMIYYQPGSFKIYKDIVPSEPVLTINVTPCSRYAPFVYPYLEDGITTQISSIPQIPTRFLDPQIKNVSRLHYWLACQECGENEAILLDEHGHLAEGSGYNLGFFKGNRLHVPHGDNHLQGVTIASCWNLWQSGYKGMYSPYDLISADSIILSSTFRGIIPSYRLVWRGREYVLPNVDDCANKLMDKFSQHVGLDVKEQWKEWMKKK